MSDVADDTAARPPVAGSVDWLVAMLRHNQPDGLRSELVMRLGDVAFSDLLTALESLIGRADRGRMAIALYRAWIKAQGRDEPYLSFAWFNLGAETSAAGDTETAAQAYQMALALKPDLYAAAVNLGLLHEARGTPEAALAIWDQATQTNAARTTLLNHRARLLEQSGQLEEAARLLRASLATDPAQPDVVQHWVHLRQSMCQWPVLAGETAGLTRAQLIADCGPLSALALTDRVAAQTAITARWIARKTAATPSRLSPEDGYEHNTIRLGYLSSDLGGHALGYLIAELFERHDRHRFTVYGYCIGREDGSALRARIVRSFDHFVSLRDLSDEAAARRIAADEIDILVDLNGLTAGARPQILRWRPAPIQATYLGFIGPVPIPELDYLFCDSDVVPQQTAAAYFPKPLPVASLYQANDTRRVVGPVTSRAENGLPEDAFVFCCFAKHYKVTEEMFGTWMTILGRVPHAVLWLASDNVWSERNMRAAAERQGIAGERLIFAERVGPASYIRRLAIADLFLDTFPYNAGTIASDAIRMGLPILTLEGEAFAARMAARLLRAIDATDGIAPNLASYIATAVTLANQPDRHARYRARFSEARWRQDIGNIERFTAEYENTLKSVHIPGHRSRPEKFSIPQRRGSEFDNLCHGTIIPD